MDDQNQSKRIERINNFPWWLKNILIPIILILIIATTAHARGPFWIRVLRPGHIAVATGLGPQPPTFAGETRAFTGLQYHIVGWFDVQVGNTVEIYVDDVRGGNLATLQSQIDSNLNYWYMGLTIPQRWNGRWLRIQAMTIEGTTQYWSDVALLQVGYLPPPPPPPPPKPGVWNSVGQNTFAGFATGAVGNLFGGSLIKRGVRVLSGVRFVLFSTVAIGLSSGVGTFVWNVGKKIFDPPGTPPKRTIGGQVALGILGVLTLLLALISHFAARQRRTLVMVILAFYLSSFCFLVYVPKVALTNPKLFYSTPWLAFLLAVLMAWIAFRIPQRILQIYLKTFFAVLIAGFNFGLVALVTDFASAWSFLGAHQYAVGCWFVISAILVEFSVFLGSLRLNE